MHCAGCSFDANIFDFGPSQGFRVRAAFAHRNFLAGKICELLNRGVRDSDDDKLIDKSDGPAETDLLAPVACDCERSYDDVAMALVELGDEIVLFLHRNKNRLETQPDGEFFRQGALGRARIALARQIIGLAVHQEADKAFAFDLR